MFYWFKLKVQVESVDLHFLLSPLSGLRLRQVPSEQYDGSNTLWFPDVHGKHFSIYITERSIINILRCFHSEQKFNKFVLSKEILLDVLVFNIS